MAQTMQPQSTVANIQPQKLPTSSYLGSEKPVLTPPKEAERQIDKGEVPPTPSAETKTEDQASARIAAFAKRERMLQKMAQDLKTREEALKTKDAEYDSAYIPKSKLKENALQVLLDQGISYEDLTKQILNQPNPENPDIQKLRAKIEELEAKQNQTSTQFDEQQKRSYEQAVTQIRNEAKILTDSNPEFDTIKQTGSTEAIVELIQETFNKKGVLMSVEDAAKEVEDYLVEEAFKMSQFSKVKARLAPKPEETLGEPEKTQTRTLTHANSSPAKPLSPRERALLAFRGELK